MCDTPSMAFGYIAVGNFVTSAQPEGVSGGADLQAGPTKRLPALQTDEVCTMLNGVSPIGPTDLALGMFVYVQRKGDLFHET
jgi:hypothetical protein